MHEHHHHEHHHHDHHHDHHDHHHDHECTGTCQGCASQCEHTPMEELMALMKYMVGHNAAHAQELAELAEQLEQTKRVRGPPGTGSVRLGHCGPGGGLGDPRVVQAPALPDCVTWGPYRSLCASVSSSVREASESPLHAIT